METEVSLQKFNYLVSSLFTEKASAIPTKILKEFLHSKLTDEEKARFAEADPEKNEN